MLKVYLFVLLNVTKIYRNGVHVPRDEIQAAPRQLGRSTMTELAHFFTPPKGHTKPKWHWVF